MAALDVEDAHTALPPAAATALRASLLDWYDTQHRVLPWRRNSHSRRAAAADDPPPAAPGAWPPVPGVAAPLEGLPRGVWAYGVWTSEVMLQQTQVERVTAYFMRWMARWPTLQHLAAAKDEEVQEAWAGLGYYRRARLLLEGARYAVAHTGGELPTTRAALLKVPGIGAYTAASLSSIAFGEAAAAVDGNVVRVLSRLHALAQAAPASSKAVKQMQALADALLARERPGDWNQAVMELGATAHDAASGAPAPAVTDFPPRVAKAPRRREAVCVRIVEWADADTGAAWLLMLRRPDAGLLAGQFEFPTAASAADAPAAERHAALDALLSSLGLPEAHAAAAAHAADVVHVFSHIEHAMAVSRVTLQLPGPPRQLASGDAALPEWRWVAQHADGSAPAGLTGGVRKAWEAGMQRAPPSKPKRAAKKAKLDDAAKPDA